MLEMEEGGKEGLGGGRGWSGGQTLQEQKLWVKEQDK